jgi:hypothetical protein
MNSMIQRAAVWLGGFGVLESGRRFNQQVAASRALREADAAAERDADGDSLPPPASASEDSERDSGPDLFDGMASSLRP